VKNGVGIHRGPAEAGRHVRLTGESAEAAERSFFLCVICVLGG